MGREAKVTSSEMLAASKHLDECRDCRIETRQNLAKIAELPKDEQNKIAREAGRLVEQAGKSLQTDEEVA